MEQIIFSLLATIVGGIVILIIEYKYFKSNESPRHINPPNQIIAANEKPQYKYKNPKEYFDAQKGNPSFSDEYTKPPISEAYQRLALILVSLVSAYGASYLFRLWAEDYALTSQSFLALLLTIISSEDFVFLIVLLIMIISGGVIAYLVDDNVDTNSTSLLPRYLLTILVSFIGAYLGCIIVPILILIFIPKDGVKTQ